MTTMETKKTLAVAALALVALSAYPSSAAYAHGGGVLRAVPRQVAIGGTINVTGEKLGKNADLKAELRGVLDNYPLQSVRTSALGTLAATVTIPVSVPPGIFTLVVIAADGDVAGRTEVTVGPPGEAAAAAESGMPHMESGGKMADMAEMKGTAEMMKIEVKTTPAEWAVIAVLILASFAGGVALIARSAGESGSSQRKVRLRR